MSYLYGDQLGSVSFATSANGSSTSRQDFDAWGAVRSGGISQTTLNYTGQRLDSTGLLDYHARLYDPLLARFVSADSVVPSSASGGLDGVQRKPLTVDFHEPGFVATLNGENTLGFWFQLSDDDRQQAGVPWGPANPQALNRYSYVLNAPVRWTDPRGHSVYLTHTQAEDYANSLKEYANYIRSKANSLSGPGLVTTLVGLVPGLGIIGGGGAIIGGVAYAESGIHAGGIFDFDGWADNIDKYAELILGANKDSQSGVIISVADQGDPWGDYCGGGCNATIISRDTGNGSSWRIPGLPGRMLFSGGGVAGQPGEKRGSVWISGHACTYSGENPVPGNYYTADHALCH